MRQSIRCPPDRCIRAGIGAEVQQEEKGALVVSLDPSTGLFRQEAFRHLLVSRDRRSVSRPLHSLCLFSLMSPGESDFRRGSKRPRRRRHPVRPRHGFVDFFPRHWRSFAPHGPRRLWALQSVFARTLSVSSFDPPRTAAEAPDSAPSRLFPRDGGVGNSPLAGPATPEQARQRGRQDRYAG